MDPAAEPLEKKASPEGGGCEEPASAAPEVGLAGAGVLVLTSAALSICLSLYLAGDLFLGVFATFHLLLWAASLWLWSRRRVPARFPGFRPALVALGVGLAPFLQCLVWSLDGPLGRLELVLPRIVPVRHAAGHSLPDDPIPTPPAWGGFWSHRQEVRHGDVTLVRTRQELPDVGDREHLRWIHALADGGVEVADLEVSMGRGDDVRAPGIGLLPSLPVLPGRRDVYWLYARTRGSDRAFHGLVQLGLDGVVRVLSPWWCLLPVAAGVLVLALLLLATREGAAGSPRARVAAGLALALWALAFVPLDPAAWAMPGAAWMLRGDERMLGRVR